MYEVLDYLIITLLTTILFVTFYPRIYVMMSKNVIPVTAEEAYELINSKKSLVIIDVRNKEEYRSGHIKGAKSFPIKDIGARMNELKKYKNKPVLIHCSSGNRSVRAVRILLKNGFTNIYHMKRGLKGWSYGLK